MTTTEIRRYTEVFTTALGDIVEQPFFHIVLINEKGDEFRHFYRFEGWYTYTAEDGSEIVVTNRRKEALLRAENLKTKIDEAIRRDDVYGLNVDYWNLIQI